jgi:hypothetical protein
MYRVTLGRARLLPRDIWTKVVCFGMIADQLLRIGERSGRAGVSLEVL